MCFFLAMGGEAPPEDLKRRMKCNAEQVRDRVQAQAQPIIRKHGLIEGLALARPEWRKQGGKKDVWEKRIVGHYSTQETN